LIPSWDYDFVVARFAAASNRDDRADRSWGTWFLPFPPRVADRNSVMTRQKHDPAALIGSSHRVLALPSQLQTQSQRG